LTADKEGVKGSEQDGRWRRLLGGEESGKWEVQVEASQEGGQRS
jgi:hypothetical protein